MIGVMTARMAAHTHRLPQWLAAVVAIAAGIAVGWLVVRHPMLAEAPAALLVGLLLLASPRARILFIVFGALLVFQSSDQLDAKKMLFLSGAAVAFSGAFLRSRRLISTPAYQDLSPLFFSSVVFFGLFLVSFPVARYYGTTTKAWVRDIAPFVLVACAPLFALDAQSAMSARALRRLIAFAGVAGGAAFALKWIGNRGFAHVTTIGLPTFMLGAALFAFGAAVVLEGRRGWLRWLALSSLLLAMLISTGSRSAVALLAAPLAIILGTRERFAKRALRIAIVVPLAALLVVLGAQSVLRLVHADQQRVVQRARLIFHTGGLSTDRSYLDRVNQTKAAWKIFKEAPVLGRGPGQSFQWQDSFGHQMSSPNIDSSLEYLAKFGSVGLVPLLVFAGAFISFLRRVRWRTGETTAAQLGLIGFGGVILAWWSLGVPFADKGLSSGLLLLYALAAREAGTAASTAVDSDARIEAA